MAVASQAHFDVLEVIVQLDHKLAIRAKENVLLIDRVFNLNKAAALSNDTRTASHQRPL
jgi:hypothetical protein